MFLLVEQEWLARFLNYNSCFAEAVLLVALECTNIVHVGFAVVDIAVAEAVVLVEVVGRLVPRNEACRGHK